MAIRWEQEPFLDSQNGPRNGQKFVTEGKIAKTERSNVIKEKRERERGGEEKGRGGWKRKIRRGGEMNKKFEEGKGSNLENSKKKRWII